MSVDLLDYRAVLAAIKGGGLLAYTTSAETFLDNRIVPAMTPEQRIMVVHINKKLAECLRDYQVGIKFLSIGCIISVGCKEVPFSTVKEGMKALNDYVANPYETRTVWQERFAKEEEL